MREEDNVLLVCNPADAIIFVEHDRKVLPALVMADAVNTGTVYVVKREEFLDWLEEKGERKEVSEEESEEGEE